MCEKKNNLWWSGRPRMGFVYPSRAVLTSSLCRWKIFVRLIFVIVGHRQNIFNDEKISRSTVHVHLLTFISCLRSFFTSSPPSPTTLSSIIIDSSSSLSSSSSSTCRLFLFPLLPLPTRAGRFVATLRPWSTSVTYNNTVCHIAGIFCKGVVSHFHRSVIWDYTVQGYIILCNFIVTCLAGPQMFQPLIEKWSNLKKCSYNLGNTNSHGKKRSSQDLNLGLINVRASDQHSKDRGSNPGWTSMSCFINKQICNIKVHPFTNLDISFMYWSGYRRVGLQFSSWVP